MQDSVLQKISETKPRRSETSVFSLRARAESWRFEPALTSVLPHQGKEKKARVLTPGDQYTRVLVSALAEDLGQTTHPFEFLLFVNS